MQKHGLREFFSLSDCSMTVARAFIDYLLEFAFYFGVPLKHFELPKDPEDLVRHVYMCIKHKRCCICGNPADIHHYDAIGMGRDRRKYDDAQHRKLPLCRGHHGEAHNIGADTFCEKYILVPIVYIEGIYGGNFDTDNSVAEKLE
ncbi:MAG: hypothetical protein HGB11_13490 [Chlorobiales bacterium]|nr:hypothetical protein [Chlorobiales bacterium]